MPNSLAKKYLMCDKPPPLDKLNPYRDDNKDAIKVIKMLFSFKLAKFY